MTDRLEKLEAELKRLRPAPLPEELSARIEREMHAAGAELVRPDSCFRDEQRGGRGLRDRRGRSQRIVRPRSRGSESRDDYVTADPRRRRHADLRPGG